MKYFVLVLVIPTLLFPIFSTYDNGSVVKGGIFTTVYVTLSPDYKTVFVEEDGTVNTTFNGTVTVRSGWRCVVKLEATAELGLADVSPSSMVFPVGGGTMNITVYVTETWEHVNMVDNVTVSGTWESGIFFGSVEDDTVQVFIEPSVSEHFSTDGEDEGNVSVSGGVLKNISATINLEEEKEVIASELPTAVRFDGSVALMGITDGTTVSLSLTAYVDRHPFNASADPGVLNFTTSMSKNFSVNVQLPQNASPGEYIVVVKGWVLAQLGNSTAEDNITATCSLKIVSQETTDRQKINMRPPIILVLLITLISALISVVATFISKRRR